MALTEKQKKIIAAVPLIILVYLAVTLILYDHILQPEVNKLTGKVATTVNVSEGLPSNCSFMLYEEENLISFHCIYGTYPRDFLLQNISGKYYKIFKYSANDADKWKSYNPSLPNWAIQDLNYIDDDEGMWIFMSQNSTYDLGGILNTHTQTQLYAGWNLIGYPRGTPTTPDIAFSSLNGNYDLVLQFKKENNTWYYYAPSDPASNLTMIEPDFGYWIHMTAADIWVYPP